MSADRLREDPGGPRRADRSFFRISPAIRCDHVAGQRLGGSGAARFSRVPGFGRTPVKSSFTPRLAAAAAAAVLLLAAGAARASDATTLADRAGFLVGHALRCGVAETRLQRSAALIAELIEAYALDSDDRSAARSAFAEEVAASVSATAPGAPLPRCATVRAQFSRLEQHLPLAASPARTDERPVAAAARTGTPAARSATAKPTALSNPLAASVHPG